MPKRRFVHDSRFGRRRRPLRRIELFHIVHEIEPDGFRRTGIERREHAGLAICVDYRRLLKSRIARELRHVLRAFRISTVLRRDRHLRDPILQPLHRLIVALRDFGFDVGVFIARCDAASCRKGERCYEYEEFFIHIVRGFPALVLMLS